MLSRFRGCLLLLNADKPDRWKADIARSVDFYNDWFMRFAPKAYHDTRVTTTSQVKAALGWTANLTNISPAVLRERPSMLPMLRMATAPPIARDRLIGLAGVSSNLILNMEIRDRIPPRLKGEQKPTKTEVHRSATIIADRLCGAVSDPIIRNAQERRQLASVKDWLEQRGYSYVKSGEGLRFNRMKPGTFSFRLNMPVHSGERQINIPIDVAIMPLGSEIGDLPILIEAKSAGDYTNPNKRRKEEATKITQLRKTYGDGVRFILFLCGYFDSGYLGYEAAEGIDWVWEHPVWGCARVVGGHMVQEGSATG